MKIIILAIGKEKDFSGYEIVSEYINRIGHYYPVDLNYISGTDKEDENKKLVKFIDKINEQSFIVALDETGKKLSSVGLSELFEKVTNQSFKNIIFIIGGAYGISSEIKEGANLVLSLSDMTFTHTMTRMIIAEQIYRACTIQKGEKYHHN